MNWISDIWWSQLNSKEQMLWIIALVFSVLWLIQRLMVWTSSEESEPTPTPYEPSFYRYSASSLIAGIALWGWSSAITYAWSSWAPVAVGIGSILVIMSWELTAAWRARQRLGAHLHGGEEEASIAVLNPIPAGRKGIGRIALTKNDKTLEVDALTDGPTLQAGTKVKVKEIIGQNLIRVELMLL